MQKAHWEHYQIGLQQDTVNTFLLSFLNQFPQKAYFDRIQTQQEIICQVHIKLETKEDRSLLKQFKQTDTLVTIPNYDLSQELSTLFFGEHSTNLYLNVFLQSMSFIQHWLTLLISKEFSLTNIAFETMCDFILNPDIQGVFLSPYHEKIPLAFLSLRSHADGYFIRGGSEQVYRTRMENLYQTHKTKFHARFLQISQKQNLQEHNQLWSQQIHRLFKSMEAAIIENEIKFYPEPGDHIADHYLLSVDNIHYKTRNNTALNRYIQQHSNMKIFRLLTGLMYLNLHRIGLSMLDRNFLCYALSRTVEDVFQTNLDESIELLTQRILAI